MPRHVERESRHSEADRLRELRASMGVSQRELAEEFNVAAGAIAQWESGARTVPGPVLRLIELYESELGPSSRPRPSHVAPPTGWLRRTAASSSSIMAWLAARSLLPLAPSGAIAGRLRERAVQRYVQSASRLKGLSMKWAQLAWSMDALLQPHEAAALSALRRTIPAMSPSRAAAVFLEDQGATPRQRFAQWSSQPFSAGSIGQVHAATLPTGQRVAVKIQYPGVAALLQQDLRNVGMLDDLSRIFLRQQRPGVLHAEMRERFLEECDYALEARHQTQMRAAFEGHADILIPEVFPGWSSGRVLTTALVEGRTLEEFAATASQAERDRAGAAVWRFYYRSVLVRGAYNTDPHPGNFLFLPDRVAFLDFGRVRRLPEVFRRTWRDLGRALFERDRRRAEELLIALDYVPDPSDFDFGPTLRLLSHWTLPCLQEGGFAFTPEYLRTLWQVYLADSTRQRVSFSPEMIFLPQLLFGVAAVLTRLRARVPCREIHEALLYSAEESVPPAYSPAELAEVA